MRQYDAAWLARVEAHVRKEKVKEAPSRRGQAAVAAREACVVAGEGRGERLCEGAPGYRGPMPGLRAAGATGRGLAGAVVAGSRKGY